MLRNRHYLGEIVHKGVSHPGLHPPIVERELFDAVQARLGARKVHRRKRQASRAPLAGILFDALGNRMAATHARGRGDRRYLYYISSVPASHPDADRVLRRVPAPAVEEIVMERLRAWSSRPASGWSDLLPFLKRVEVHREAIVVDLLPPAHESWTAAESERCSRLDDGLLRITSPVKVNTRGGRTTRVDGLARPVRSNPDRALIAGLRRAHAELGARGMELAVNPSLGKARGIDDPYLRKLTRLAFLAPDIQRAILEGRQPPALKLADLLASELPLSWDQQRRQLGFA